RDEGGSCHSLQGGRCPAQGCTGPLGAQPRSQPAHAAWGRGTIPQPQPTLTIVPWPHQVRRRARTSPARLTPTAAPSAAPGRGPALPSSVPGSCAGGYPGPWPQPRGRPALTPALLRSNGSLGDWVPVAGRGGQFNASFTDPSFCPFAEELHQLQLRLEGISDTSFFNFTSPRFFIRDIVRPDPPQELTVHQQRGQLHLAWAPPASWPLPKSYFALLYRLQYELSNGTQVEKFVEGAEETIVRGHVQRVRISCQDPYAKPSWSPWSPWQVVDAAQQHRLRAH
uniref:Interleukin-12 subunit beta n=1 Tax=Anser brachyrhynchus TaxID=132585 RepID=A0A8B9CVU2_9AVES